jgi:AmiR/NasT family two-component response regulator
MVKSRTLVRSGMRVVREAPQILRDLRSLRVCVFHPRDQDGQGLTRQLERIGCQVQAFWPPLPELPEGIDVVFMALSPDMLDADFAWCQVEDGPPVIAVITYENPTVIEAVLRVGAIATVASPVRSFGLLSVLVLARDLDGTIRKQKKRISQLEAKLQGVRQIAEAQDILAVQHGITKEEAYHIIREQAMQKRVTAEEIARSIINANEILGSKRLKG